MPRHPLFVLAAVPFLLTAGPTPLQTPPTADNITISVAPGESILIPYSGADADGDLFGFFRTSDPSDPAAGTLLDSCVCRGTYAGVICSCTTTFTAATDFAGTFTFTYRAVDLAGNVSADATVTIQSTAQTRTPLQIAAEIRRVIERGTTEGGGIDDNFGAQLNHRLDKVLAAIADADRSKFDLEMEKTLILIQQHAGDPHKITGNAVAVLLDEFSNLWRSGRVPVFTDDTLRVAGVRVGDDLSWTRGKSVPDGNYEMEKQVAGASAGSLGPVADHSWWICVGDANGSLPVTKNDDQGEYNHIAACEMNPTAQQGGFDKDNPHYIGRVMALMHLKIEGFTSKEGFAARTTELLVHEEIAPEIGDPLTGIGTLIDFIGTLRSLGFGFTWHLNSTLTNHLVDFTKGGTYSAGESKLPNAVLARTTTEWYQKDESGLLIPGTKREVTTDLASRKIGK